MSSPTLTGAPAPLLVNGIGTPAPAVSDSHDTLQAKSDTVPIRRINFFIPYFSKVIGFAK